MWVAGTRIAGRFVVEREAGRGGMGIVYAARDDQTGERVAVKVLSRGTADDTARFMREASVLGSLRAPGIVRYLGHGKAEDGYLYLAMEWLEGEDLGKRLERGALATDAALAIVEEVARALAVAHELKLVHRDIKPSNVFLVGGEVPTVKLLDFGIARSLARGATLTATGAMLGTPQYMSPEQARGERAVDARADVFALGAVLFECIAGRPAYEGAHALAVLAAVLLEQAPRLSERVPEVSPAVDALVARMMTRERSMRPESASAVLIELAALRTRAKDGLAPTIPPPPAALSGAERRFVSLVVASREQQQPGDETVDAASDAAVRERCESLGLDHGGVVEFIGASAVLAVVAHAGTAREQAGRAVRLGRALGAELGGAMVCVVTGHTVMKGTMPTADFVRRALDLAQAPSPASQGSVDSCGSVVRVDTLTASLLDGSFDFAIDERGAQVRGERSLLESHAVVLGKRSAFVGRDRELALLDAALASVAEESELRAVLVIGSPGLGKSRLAAEMAARARRRGDVRIVSVRTDSTAAGSPHRVIAALLRELTGSAAATPDAAREAMDEAAARAFDDGSAAHAATMLGHLVGATVRPQDAEVLRAALADPVLFADLVRRYVRGLLSSAAQQPLLVVLEDLHWADVPSVELLGTVAEALRDHPILLLATARPEVDQRFARLWARLPLERLALSPIARKSAERLLRDLLGSAATSEVVKAIVDRGEGSPLFLEELARAATEGPGGELPGSVLATLQARLDALGEAPRRALRAASTFGERLWPAGVAAVLGLVGDDGELGRTLDALVVGDALVVRTPGLSAGEREYAFRSALLRDAAYALWSDDDRRTAHLRAGRWLQRAGERDPVVLARHFSEAGATGEAAHHWLAAAERAYVGSALDAALDFAGLARAGVEGVGGAELATRLDLLESEVHFHRNDLVTAERLACAVLERAPRGTELWLRAATSAIPSAGQLGHNDVVAQIATQLVDLEIADDDRVNTLAIGLARSMTQLGTGDRRAEFERLAQRLRALVASRPRLPAHVRAHVARALGTQMVRDRRLEQGAEHLQECVDAYETLSDTRGAAFARTGLASMRIWLGEPEAAEATARQAIADATRTGSGYLTDWARYALGKVLLELGSFDAALAEHAHVADTVKDSPRIVAGAHLHASLALSALGRPVEAEERARRAVELGKTSAVRAGAAAALSRALLGLGRTAEALAASTAAFEVLEDAGLLEEFEPLVRVAHAEALDRAGRRADALAVVTRAREISLATAESIGSPERRASFLARPRETARLMRLAREWLERGG